MKRILSLLVCLISWGANAQITIAAGDMPVAGDTLRYSISNPIGSTINLSQTGANTSWDFSALVPVSQGLDHYKTALQVNPLYALTIAVNAYGYKVADSFGANGQSLPVAVNDLYTFFSKKSNPSRFVAEAFAANISGLPTAINYSNEDELYYFPLQYNDIDSSTFRLSYNLLTVGSFSQTGSRKTTVDGWGTILTPHFTTTVPCLRVRSEIIEQDTIKFGTTNLGLPRRTVEYKWLANGEHYPVLWITTNVTAGNETITSVRFRDHYRPALSISDQTARVQYLRVYPNPAADKIILDVPADWKNYVLEMYDMAGRAVITGQTGSEINVSSLAPGKYIVRVISGSQAGICIFTK
jgi:hypothetical protein